MKVRVTGLQPATIYYFRTVTTSKATPDTTYAPAAAPYRSVATETQNGRILYLQYFEMQAAQ